MEELSYNSKDTVRNLLCKRSQIVHVQVPCQAKVEEQTQQDSMM